MIPRLHASSKLLALTRVHRDSRLTFSSSAIILARRTHRSGGEQTNLATANRRTEDELEEEEAYADPKEEEAELDRWLLAGKEKVNETDIRSYKDSHGHFRKNVAPSFREPSPRNWLGRDVPFPLNPSFKPPVPLSDELRTRLYRAYMTDPTSNSVRALATKYNISIKRVDAILRLKGMEKAWKKNKALQTGFTKGMEYLLGVTETARHKELDDNKLLEEAELDSSDRYDAHEADLQNELEGNDRARHRYQRLFWESVAEGEEPIMPDILEAQCGTSLMRSKLRGKTTTVERAPGRPAIKFVDVGNAFVDAKEKERREREGARRSMLKTRKRMENSLHA